MDPFIYRECRATITARIPDTPDADQHPDRVLVQGRGTAHPQFQGGSVVFTEIGEYAIPQPVPVVIVDGELLVEVLSGDESVEMQPLFLPVTVDERANQNWSWRLTFDFLTLGEYGEEVPHPPLSFPVEAGDGPLEISTVATPVIKSQGFVTRGQRGLAVTNARRIDDSHIEFLLEDGGTTQPVELGMGRDGSNVLPTGVAIAQAIGPEGVARVALDTAIGQVAVTSPSVGRIITSTDPAEPLADGEVLLVYQGPRSWSDRFDDGMFGMTPRWNRRGDWSWDAGAIVTAPSTTSRKALSIDELGDQETDVEMLAEITPDVIHSTFHHGVIMQGSGSPGRENGWAIGFQGVDLNLVVFNDGVYTTHYRQAPNIVSGRSQMIRARIENGRIMIRSWPSGETEPTAWDGQMDVLGGSRPGWCGLVGSTHVAQRWERVAVATQGGTAVFS